MLQTETLAKKGAKAETELQPETIVRHMALRKRRGF
jgi:hypothetical protein